MRTISPRMRTMGGMPAEMWRSEAPWSWANPSSAVRSKAMASSREQPRGLARRDGPGLAQRPDVGRERRPAVGLGHRAQLARRIAVPEQAAHRLGNVEHL